MPIFLIIIGIIIIVLNVKALKKEDNSFETILKNREENVQDYQVEIGEIRREFSETIIDLQKEIYNLQEELKLTKEYFQGNIKINEEKKEIVSEIPLEDDKVYEEEIIGIETLTEKVNKVNELLKAGFSDDEICEKLAIGKGEVLLIRGLYKV